MTAKAIKVFLSIWQDGSINVSRSNVWRISGTCFMKVMRQSWKSLTPRTVYQIFIPVINDKPDPERLKEATGMLLAAYTADVNANIMKATSALADLLTHETDVSTR